MKINTSNMSRRKQLEKILEFTGRRIEKDLEIVDIERYYEKNNVFLFNSAKEFFKEYGKIIKLVYLCFEEENSYYDLNFQFCPNEFIELSEIMNDEDYSCERILKFANEECIVLGLLGYYYPGVLAIGESGDFYLHHYDYSDNVLKFKSMIELLDYEIPKKNIIEISSKL